MTDFKKIFYTVTDMAPTKTCPNQMVISDEGKDKEWGTKNAEEINLNSDVCRPDSDYVDHINVLHWTVACYPIAPFYLKFPLRSSSVLSDQDHVTTAGVPQGT